MATSSPPGILSLSSPHPSTLSSITPAELQELSRLSAAAKERAYCPYSKFRVGAALLSAASSDDAAAAVATSGSSQHQQHQHQYISGANVENAAYPVGICAERSALSRAVVDGHRHFRAIAVSTDISPPASPCGMCRQFIREFCDLDTPVIMFDKNRDYVVRTVEQLLPMSFGPEALPPS